MYLPWVQEGVDFFILGIRGKKKSPAAFPPLSDNKNLRERDQVFLSYDDRSQWPDEKLTGSHTY